MSDSSNKTPSLADRIGAKAKRKLRARRDPSDSVWSGLGKMGLIGWSVVVPTLLGAALGIWLDKRHPGSHSWTLALLMAGLTLGCLNAWRWMAKEESDMRADEESNDA
ncbi:MAG: AtpZ/AtpI family protein [Gemmatimonadaceae bacterium]